MKNGIEKLGSYETIEENNDVIGSLKAIEQQVFDATDGKHLSLRMVMAWRKLCSCKQQEDEDLIDCHRRFCGLIEMVESSYGNLKLKDNDSERRNKFIAMMFMDGVGKKQCGYPLKNLETDYSLGSKEVYCSDWSVAHGQGHLSPTDVRMVLDVHRAYVAALVACPARLPQMNEN